MIDTVQQKKKLQKRIHIMAEMFFPFLIDIQLNLHFWVS